MINLNELLNKSEGERWARCAANWEHTEKLNEMLGDDFNSLAELEEYTRENTPEAEHTCQGECKMEWCDDSFSHAFGVEMKGHWQCVICGQVQEPQHPFSND